MYAPSAGTVYPRLARLEEEGLVVREDDGRKATYRITDAGRAEVAARRDELAALEQDVDPLVREMADQLRSQVRRAPPTCAASWPTPPGGGPVVGHTGRRHHAGAAPMEADHLVEQLRRQVRDGVAGMAALDEAQVGEIRAALTDAWARIAAGSRARSGRGGSDRRARPRRPAGRTRWAQRRSSTRGGQGDVDDDLAEQVAVEQPGEAVAGLAPAAGPSR